MTDVRQIAAVIVWREGGVANDPDDPDGETNHGVTKHAMRRIGLDLDGDGDMDMSDVRMLSQAQAIDIFLKHYFYGPRIDALPAALQASVFECMSMTLPMP